MFVHVLVASSCCCAAERFQFTPPDTPQVIGNNYIIKHVDLDEQVVYAEDGSRVTPAEIVDAALPGFLGSIGGSQWVDFNQEWFGSMIKSFDSRATGPAEIQEFLATGKSYNQSLMMNIFAGPRNWNFGTHAHKNIEYMKVLAGTLREWRSEGLVTDFQPQDTLVPLPANGSFHVEMAPAGHFEINEFGSLHTSYTLDDGMLLLTVYNGGDWFYGVDGCQNPEFVCTPNGCGKSPNAVSLEELCNLDWTAQYVDV